MHIEVLCSLVKVIQNRTVIFSRLAINMQPVALGRLRARSHMESFRIQTVSLGKKESSIEGGIKRQTFNMNELSPKARGMCSFKTVDASATWRWRRSLAFWETRAAYAVGQTGGRVPVYCWMCPLRRHKRRYDDHYRLCSAGRPSFHGLPLLTPATTRR